APLVLLPPLAVGLVWLFAAPPDIAAGVLLVAACPIGGVSNGYSSLARASTALSVTLTGLSCLCASFTIPVIGRRLDAAAGAAAWTGGADLGAGRTVRDRSGAAGRSRLLGTRTLARDGPRSVAATPANLVHR